MIDRQRIELIHDILIQSQFQFWVEDVSNEGLTANEVNSRPRRAIDYYCGKTDDPKKPTPIEQTRFHHLIDTQMQLIIRAINDSSGLKQAGAFFIQGEK